MIRNFRELCIYRSVWMGVAIIWVLFHHFGFPEMPIIKWLVCLIGYGGVDIFFFASGIGCYFSLSKTPDILSFIKRRIVRIYPVYVPFILGYFILTYLWGVRITLEEVLGNVFMFGFLANLENQFNWYLCAVFVFYLIVPYMVQYANKYKGKVMPIASMIMGMILFSVMFWDNTHLVIMFSRYVIGFIGVVMAANGDSIEFNRKDIVILILLNAVGITILAINFKYFPEYLWSRGFNWYPFILIVPGLCYMLSVMAKKFIHIGKMLSFIGDSSLELYLSHYTLLGIIYLFEIKGLYLDHRNIVKTIIIIASFVIAFSINELEKRIKKWILTYKQHDDRNFK